MISPRRFYTVVMVLVLGILVFGILALVGVAAIAQEGIQRETRCMTARVFMHGRLEVPATDSTPPDTVNFVMLLQVPDSPIVPPFPLSKTCSTFQVVRRS